MGLGIFGFYFFYFVGYVNLGFVFIWVWDFWVFILGCLVFWNFGFSLKEMDWVYLGW